MSTLALPSVHSRFEGPGAARRVPQMKVVDIHHRDAFDLALEEIHRGPIVVQLPTVFVLLAAPTQHGARQLDASKTRLSGKNYGTAIGSLELFLAQAVPTNLPEGFSTPADFERMTGSFIRLQFRNTGFQSSTMRDGTHQGVLLDGVHRELFRRIEASFANAAPDPMWGEANYAAPLCTSCNVSGDPDGSIVRLDKALQFSRAQGVRLVLSCRETASQLGSYPIFGYERHKVSVHRDGPYLNDFKAHIPQSLRGW
jgi:hypothetical protein